MQMRQIQDSIEVDMGIMVSLSPCEKALYLQLARGYNSALVYYCQV
jgi:hypothetical protein